MAPTHVQISDRVPIGAYTEAVALLFEIQNNLQVDLRTLIRLLQVFFALPEGKVLWPLATDYPPRKSLEQQITLAVESSGAKTLVPEKMNRVLPVIITIYELYSMSVDAVAVQNATGAGASRVLHPPPRAGASVEPSELVDSDQRIRFLRPIDDIVEYFYNSLILRPNSDPTLARAVDFVYRIASQQGNEQAISGQSKEAYFSGLHRAASGMHLAFIHRATMFNAPSEAISQRQVLNFAEMATEPLVGAAEQGKFIRHLFPGKLVEPAAYNRLPALTKIALRSPYEIWPTFAGCCLQCGKVGAKFKCSLCGKTSYCDAGCQTSHWKASHKVACSMYRLLSV